MTATVEQVKENNKPGYTTGHGNFFVHGITLTGDATVYDYHSKSAKCKLKAGEVINYSLTADSRGNPKIKLETATPVAAPAGVVNNQQSIGEVTSVNRWLSVFRSICIFKAGTQFTLEQVVEATDKITKKVPV